MSSFSVLPHYEPDATILRPFAYPHYVWDFKIPRVQSINASGHKYGMSTVGVGWIIWRSIEYLPKDLIFELHYLGATDYSFNLNFSRPAHPILGQMFNFLNLGFAGYRRIMQNNLSKARLVSRALENSGYFTVLSNIHKPLPTGTMPSVAAVTDAITNKASSILKGKTEFNEEDAGKHPLRQSLIVIVAYVVAYVIEFYEAGLPVVSFRFTDEIKQQYPNVKQQWVQLQLRGIGWIVPK